MVDKQISCQNGNFYKKANAIYMIYSALINGIGSSFGGILGWGVKSKGQGTY